MSKLSHLLKSPCGKLLIWALKYIPVADINCAGVLFIFWYCSNFLFDLVEYDDKDFESEYTTVGGWCTDVLGKFPEVGDYFQFANLQVSILEVDGMRVEKVKVKVLKEEE